MRGTLWMLGLMALSLAVWPGFIRSQEEGTTDTKFVKWASETDIAEIALGQLARKQSGNAKIQEFGMHLADNHAQSSQAFLKIAKKHGFKPATDMNKQQKDMVDKLSALKGADFDRQFLLGQVKAHEEVASLFRNQMKNGENPDLKAFAGKALPMIEEHLRKAKELAGQLGDKK